MASLRATRGTSPRAPRSLEKLPRGGGGFFFSASVRCGGKPAGVAFLVRRGSPMRWKAIGFLASAAGRRWAPMISIAPVACHGARIGSIIRRRAAVDRNALMNTIRNSECSLWFDLPIVKSMRGFSGSSGSHGRQPTSLAPRGSCERCFCLPAAGAAAKELKS